MRWDESTWALSRGKKPFRKSLKNNPYMRIPTMCTWAFLQTSLCLGVKYTVWKSFMIKLPTHSKSLSRVRNFRVQRKNFSQVVEKLQHFPGPHLKVCLFVSFIYLIIFLMECHLTTASQHLCDPRHIGVLSVTLNCWKKKSFICDEAVE